MGDDAPALKDLECHFKWKQEIGANKMSRYVITNVLEKLQIEPLRAVPYHCLLSYLYTTEGNQCYQEAYESLRQADKLNNEIASGDLTSDHIACKFVVEANRLNIDAIRKERTPDHQDRVTRLHSMWNDPDENTRNFVRASVFLVKSLSYICFGPSMYQIGADAAAQSASLSPNLFHDAYLQAYLMARIRRRGDNYGVPDEVELQLWSKAVRLAEENYSTNDGNNSRKQLTVMLVYYAEAIVQFRDKKNLTESQADRAKSLLEKDFDDDLIETNYRIVMKCANVYRTLKREEKYVEMQNMLSRLKNKIKNPQILYELAMKASADKNYEEYERLLCQAQEVADAPGHVWVDYSLLRFRSGKNCNQKLTFEETVLAYDDLIAKYKDERPSRAMLTYHKGEFYASIRYNETAIIWMTKAVELLPSVKKTTKQKQRETMLGNMKRWRFRDEWLAWYMDNMMDEPNSEEITTLYQQALTFNPENEFSLHHYGLNRLRAGDLQEAEKLFRKLNYTYNSKKILLAQVLLRQIDSDQVDDSSITKLEECLTLGCKDACDIAANLLRKMQNPSSTALIQCITDRLMSNEQKAETLLTLIDTRVYELCAKIDHVLLSPKAFFADTELEETAELAVKIQESVQLTLQIKTSNADGARRGNAMREHRLKASKLFVSDPNFQTAELNDAIVSAITKAKSSFDTLLTDKEFLRRSGSAPPDYYPHGFTFAINEIKKNKDYNLAKDRLKGNYEKKQLEMNELIKWFSRPEQTIELLAPRMMDKLPKSFDISLSNTTSETLKDWLALSEAQVFCSEGPWLVLLHYMVNEEKHTRPIDIAQLNAQLDGIKKMNGNFKLPVNAYQLMHRAVEYVEETVIIFEAADCHYKDRRHSTTTEVRSEE